MTNKQPLPRNVRWVLALIVLMIVAIPVLAVRSYVADVTAAKNVVDKSEPTDERLVSVGGHTILLRSGTLLGEATDWLNVGKEQTLEVELGDLMFAPGSANLNEDATTRLAKFADLMKSHPALTARILLPTDVPSADARRLEEGRAVRLHEEMEKDGVAESRVTIEDETEDQPTAKSPHLAVLLSR